MTWEIREGDALAVLRTMESDSVDCVVTSPPYWGLRDYGHDGQLGLEPTPEAYVQAMVEAWRVKHEDAALETSEIYRDAYHAIALDLLSEKLEAKTPCVWHRGEWDDFWSATCGNVAWEFNDGGPVENKVEFCLGCGHPVQVKQPQDAATKEE